MVRVADCVPVLLADVERGVVGRGARRSPRARRRGRAGDAGARCATWAPTGWSAWVGPHVCGACYEVPEEMRADVAARGPGGLRRDLVGHALARRGRRRAWLSCEPGVVEVVRTGRCTREDDDLFSYRREGAASGRLAGLVRLRP